MKTSILFALKVNCVCKTEASVSVQIQLSQLNLYIILKSYDVYVPMTKRCKNNLWKFNYFKKQSEEWKKHQAYSVTLYFLF